MEYILSSKFIWLVGMINFMMEKAFFIMLFLFNGIGSPFPRKLALAMYAEFGDGTKHCFKKKQNTKNVSSDSGRLGLLPL